jgi:hypothetical protein
VRQEIEAIDLLPDESELRPLLIYDKDGR